MQLYTKMKFGTREHALGLSGITSIICFLFYFYFLGLVVMGRYKCEVIACLSSQTQCELMSCYIVY